MMGDMQQQGRDVIINPKFEDSLQGWSASWGNSIKLLDCESIIGCLPLSGKHYACATHRAHNWQGIEQNISALVRKSMRYKVCANVRISAPWELDADVLATLKLEREDTSTKYIHLGRVRASKTKWVELQGTMLLEEITENVVFYLEGPPPGVDLLVDSVRIEPAEDMIHSSSSAVSLKHEFDGVHRKQTDEIIQNSLFGDGLQHWSAKGCKVSICDVLHNPLVHPYQGRSFAVVTNRTDSRHGIHQDIRDCRLESNVSYKVNARVRICGESPVAEVMATLLLVRGDLEEKYIRLGRVEASTKDWACLQGRFVLPWLPHKSVAFIEGPGPGVDIIIDSFSICPTPHPEPSPPPTYEDPKFGENIVLNTDLLRGLDSWYGLGSCTLRLASGGPRVSPPTARDSLQSQTAFSGKYILVTDRKFSWQGPAQTITTRIQVYLPYQVSAWVRIGKGSSGIQKVNVALNVDGQWITGGEVYGETNSWKEVTGSFRLETQPKEVFVYVQGPSPNVDLMLANLQIFSVDRASRTKMLKRQTEKVRKRDVIIQLEASNNQALESLNVEVKQTKNSFPIGSCINQVSLENQEYVEFFLQHFNYAVFENEMKWQWDEPGQGIHNYAGADALSDFCSAHKIPIRGHCIFWEVDNFVQPWIKQLSRDQLEAAVHNRVADVVSRYAGKMQHYDVDNEMLHGDFYKRNLGPQIISDMFQLTNQVDPLALLFVNDYHVEDGRDADSSPEEYILQIQNLILEDAPVGGIGLQGHSTAPIGAIFFQALEKLSVLGLPIWLTEVDVASSNEFVRADDLEVVLREAYAHPAVEGIILWGFWEGIMSRDQANLVNCDNTLTAAGKRFIDLKKEWHSSLVAISDSQGQVQFSGFYGSYTVTVHTTSGLVEEQFELTQGEGPLTLTIGI